MALRLQGLALFLFIPAVLYLFLAQPGGWVGLVVGVVLMLGHRLVAVPFVLRNIERRCVWSGAEIAPGCVYKVEASGRTWDFHHYNEARRDKAARFFTFAQKLYWPLRIAILAPLAFFLVMELLRHFGMEVTDATTNNLVFRGVIGATTLTTFIAHRFVAPIPHMKGPVKFPLPVHNLALLGIFWTLLVFAGVGAWWVIDVLRAIL